ncbi:uncharacterized protein ACRADG_007910 [Cochliomyia hominivorax]
MLYLTLQRLIFIISLICGKNLVRTENDWTFDFVSVDVENITPNILFVDLHVTRPSRGVYAVSGIVDIREDLTDQFLLGVSIYYSPTGNSEFIKTPFNIPECNVTTLYNKYYKEIVIDSVAQCSDQAPSSKDLFQAPLTKRTIEVNNCLISNENMPSKMRPGFYKMVYEYRQQAEGRIALLIKVERKW